MVSADYSNYAFCYHLMAGGGPTVQVMSMLCVPAQQSDSFHEDILEKFHTVHRNLTPAPLYEYALARGEVRLSADGAMVAITCPHTGRSPRDKFIVEDEATRDQVDWGTVNKAISPDSFERLRVRMMDWMRDKDIFLQDLFVGADPDYRLPVRVLTTSAWHSLFARNMFIRPDGKDAAPHSPDSAAFTLIHAPEFEADPARDSTNSGTFIIIDFTRRLALIGGTSYAGEIKKTIFTVMNYLLPPQGVLPMHASANIGEEGDVAIFFGLSGTGKTTLSADPSRRLIGDDEHGWGEASVFNFEGGCYAKAIRLHPESEPEIHAASSRFGTILENVVMDPRTHIVDFDDASLAENTRSSYPLDFIPNATKDGIGGIPRNIIMLTCDAYGVLPPISKLSREQAMYHFLSGYTARVAGTEKGVTTPEATFSTCFGAPFMPRAPEVYANMLGERITRHNVDCWLINTGWSGGAAGTGHRMPIDVTRTLLRAALSGELSQATFVEDGVFGLMIPQTCEGVPSGILFPRTMWEDRASYDATARLLIELFSQNFKKFEGRIPAQITAAAIGKPV